MCRAQYHNSSLGRLRGRLGGVVLLFLLAGNFLFLVPVARADMWGANVAGAMLKQYMEKIYDYIQGALLGSLKVAAVQMLNNQVNLLIGGESSGQALFITDWNHYLNQGPAQATALYMNDFFTLTMRGKSSSANYIGVGDAGSGIGGSYPNYLVEQAKRATVDKNVMPTYDLDQYGGIEAVGEGDMRAFNAYFSNPANNRPGYIIAAEEAYQNKLSSEVEIAKLKAQSSGYLPVEKNGRVVTPAGAIEAVTNDVKTLGNKIIAAATNPAEFLSGVVVAMVNKTVNNLIQTGIGKVQANIEQAVGNVNGQISAALKDATGTLGPAARFDPAVIQRLNVNPHQAIPPPPALTNP